MVDVDYVALAKWCSEVDRMTDEEVTAELARLANAARLKDAQQRAQFYLASAERAVDRVTLGLCLVQEKVRAAKDADQARRLAEQLIAARRTCDLALHILGIELDESDGEL